MKIQIRNMEFARSSVQTLERTALIPEVGHALLAWVRSRVADTAPGVLIGGLAMSFYARPRATEDVDLLFLSVADVPKNVAGFKKHRKGAFQENDSHVEIEICTPESINLPKAVADRVVRTAVTHEGLRVASLESLIVLKLFGAQNAKRHNMDLGDVDRLVQAHPTVLLTDWPLSDEQKSWFDLAKKNAR